jgi:hypothetical protein
MFWEPAGSMGVMIAVAVQSKILERVRVYVKFSGSIVHRTTMHTFYLYMYDRYNA